MAAKPAGSSAGKLPLINAFPGLQRAAAGRIHYNGDDVTGLPAFEFVRCGRSAGRRVSGLLTVEEDLAMGAYTRRDRVQVKADRKRVFSLFPRLDKPGMGFAPILVQYLFHTIRLTDPAVRRAYPGE